MFDWLTLIQKELIGDIDPSADPQEVLETRADPGFRDMGVVPMALFEYTFEFSGRRNSCALAEGICGIDHDDI